MKRRSFLARLAGAVVAAFTPVAAAAVCAPRSGSGDWRFGAGVADLIEGSFNARRIYPVEEKLARDFPALREPQVLCVLSERPDLPPRPGDLVYFWDPDRVYRAPGDLTAVSRGRYAFPQLADGRFYACHVRERLGHNGDYIRAVIDPASWF